MNDSGINKKRINDAKQAVKRFRSSGRIKLMIDIAGLTHRDIEKIVYGNIFNAMRKMFLYMISSILYFLPFSGTKKLFYRACGVTIGKNVYIGPAVYLDMMNPSLVTIGDNVMIGMHVSIMVHERTMNTLSLGKVSIGSGVTIGGYSIVRHATKIGDNVEIDMMCNVHRSIQSGMKIINTNCREARHDEDI